MRAGSIGGSSASTAGRRAAPTPHAFSCALARAGDRPRCGLDANAPHQKRRPYATVNIEPTTTDHSTTVSTHTGPSPCRSDSSAASFATYPANGGSPIIDAVASPPATAVHGRALPTPVRRRRSRVPAAASTTPTTRNSEALNIACAPIIASPASAAPRVPRPTSRMMRPSWLTVPNARTSLRSYCRSAR